MKIRPILQPITLAISVALFVTACSDSVSSSSGNDANDGNNGGGTVQFDESALIANITNNIISPTFASFEFLSNQLEQSVEQYCTLEKSFAAGNTTEQDRNNQKSASQQQWRDTMGEWQKIEVMQLGPLLENQSSLRNKIYSWPVVNACAVDQDVVFFNVGNINGTPYDIKNRVETRRGLDALEYLLFNTNLDDSCTAGTSPVGWAALDNATRREWRCEFATEAAKDVADNAQVLMESWNSNDGYAQSLLNAATQSGSDFQNLHEAVNRISDAMFYLDTVTKDAKLAIPVGLAANSCQQNACPENLESQFANNSLANIRNNLIALKALFTGEIVSSTETLGFDDYLIEEGAATTALDIRTAIDATIANIDNYQVNLNQALQTDPSQVEATHQQLKAVSDQLKTDFINQLALQLPASSAGDND